MARTFHCDIDVDNRQVYNISAVDDVCNLS